VTALLVSASLLVAVGAAFALIAPETHRGHAPAPKI
jgi:hypothetical protein